MTKIFLATLLAFSATPVLAERRSPSTSIVQTADLDLSTAKGQQALDLRLSQAVKEVCGTASTSTLPARMKFAAAASIRSPACRERTRPADRRRFRQPIEVAAR